MAMQEGADQLDAGVALASELEAVCGRVRQALAQNGLASTATPGPAGVFGDLLNAIDPLRRSGGDSEALLIHLRYLADKAGVPIEVLAVEKSLRVDPQYVWDALSNIAEVLRAQSERPAASVAPEWGGGILALIEKAEKELGGWCTRDKAQALVDAILGLRPEVAVEVGVFGGRSAIPCAAALQSLGGGALYCIESWSNTQAVEHSTSPGNDDWWAKVDFAKIKADFFRFVVDNGLTSQVRVVEAPSAKAAALFDQIDFLHIDGAHSTVNAAEDVILYAQKVRRGGLIVFDDVDWPTTAPAMEILRALCDTEKVGVDPESGRPSYALMRRR